MSSGRKRPSAGVEPDPRRTPGLTFTASFQLSEDKARRLHAALSEHETLSSLPVDASERSPDRWDVILYFEAEPDAPTQSTLMRVAREVLGRSAHFELAELPDTDWVARSLEGLPPVRAGRFLVHGAHDRGKVGPNDIAIEIEAGQAFGTGHHGTTTGCLLAIDRIAQSRPIRNALDVGTGSGVLAIAIAKAAKARVLASDIDPVAAKVARENARSNGVSRFVEVRAAAGLGAAIFRARAPFDLVVANILAAPLVQLAPAVRRLVAPGGEIVLSGLLPEHRARVVSAYRGQGLFPTRTIIREGWLTLAFRRPSNQNGRRQAPPAATRYPKKA